MFDHLYWPTFSQTLEIFRAMGLTIDRQFYRLRYFVDPSLVSRRGKFSLDRSLELQPTVADRYVMVVVPSIPVFVVFLSGLSATSYCCFGVRCSTKFLRANHHSLQLVTSIQDQFIQRSREFYSEWQRSRTGQVSQDGSESNPALETDFTPATYAKAVRLRLNCVALFPLFRH